MVQGHVAVPVKRLFAAGICLALVLSLVGCAGGNSSGTAGNTSVESEAVRGSADDQLETYQYTFQPHVISKEYSVIYGEGIDTEFFSFCDTILAGRNTFPCSTNERFHQLLGIARTCFPLAEAVIDQNNTKVENGICYLAYLSEGVELKEAICIAG